MLGAELLQAMNQRKLKVLDDINVGLASKLSEYCRGGSAVRALMRETYGPTASMIDRKSFDDVTSTLTHRFDCFLSIASRRSLAAGFICLFARSA